MNNNKELGRLKKSFLYLIILVVWGIIVLYGIQIKSENLSRVIFYITFLIGALAVLLLMYRTFRGFRQQFLDFAQKKRTNKFILIIVGIILIIIFIYSIAPLYKLLKDFTQIFISNRF